MSKFALVLATLAVSAPALAQSANAYINDPPAYRSYAYHGPTQQVVVIRHRHHDRYWKPGDLWPRSRGLLDRNAPGCPYRSC